MDYWWEPTTGPSGSQSWTLQQIVPAYSSGWAGPHSIAWTGGSVIITATDACGDLDYWWQQYATSTWNHQRVSTNPNWPAGTC